MSYGENVIVRERMLNSRSPNSVNSRGTFLIPIIFLLLSSAATYADDPSTIAKLATQSMLLDGVSTDGLMAAVGERGHMLISSDGKNWEQVIVPTRTTLTGVFFRDRNNGWAVGHDAVILRTTDAGKNWQKVYSDRELQSPLFDIRFSDTSNGIAIGAYGTYLVSEDGGASWEVGELNVAPDKAVSAAAADEKENEVDEDDDFQDAYDLHLNSIAVSNSGHSYIAAESGQIYRSDDSEQTWVLLPSPYVGSLFGVLPLEGDTVLVFGLRGHLFRSQDAGASWKQVETPTQEMLTNGIMVTIDEIYITGLGGTILKSNDGGNSFIALEQGHRDGFMAIMQSPAGDLITVGEKGIGLLH